jgi:hypothetical protein
LNLGGLNLSVKLKMAEKGSTIPVFRRPAGQAKAGPLMEADPNM